MKAAEGNEKRLEDGLQQGDFVEVRGRRWREKPMNAEAEKEASPHVADRRNTRRSDGCHGRKSPSEPRTKIFGRAFIRVKNALRVASLCFHSSGLTKCA